MFFPIPGRYGLFFLAGFSRVLLDKLCGSLSKGLEGGAGHLLHPAGQLELGAGRVCLQKVGEQGPELVLASKLFYNALHFILIFNRPGVAGAVLHRPLLLIKSLIK